MISAAAAAALLEISADRVRMLARQRRIPGARLIGREWRIPDPPVITPGARGPRGATNNNHKQEQP